MTITSAFSLGLLLAATALFALFLHWKRTQVPYPPGPPAYPLIGHLLALPTTYQEQPYRDLAKKYGMTSFPRCQ